MVGEPFLQPRWIGTRFDGGEIPLELLADLGVLREMIIDIAKWRFKEAHPDRTRSPKGFIDAISLNLTGFLEGSVALPITLKSRDIQPRLMGFSGKYTQYYEEARDYVIEAINSAERGEDIRLPAEYLKYFNRIGRGLQEEEEIIFSVDGRNDGARLNRGTRRKLVRASLMDDVAEQIGIRAFVPEMDQDRQTFHLKLIDGFKTSAKFDAHHFEVILDAFNEYKSEGKIYIKGIGKYDHQDRLKEIESIDDIVILDPLDVPSRLEELKGLQEGWFNGEGKPLDDAALDWLSDRFEQLYPDDLRLPYVFPTVEGNVLAEWSFSLHKITLDINLETHESEWYVLNMHDSSEEERLFNLDDDGSWMLMAEKIHSLIGSNNG